jgi:hypothetical protein
MKKLIALLALVVFLVGCAPASTPPALVGQANVVQTGMCVIGYVNGQPQPPYAATKITDYSSGVVFVVHVKSFSGYEADNYYSTTSGNLFLTVIYTSNLCSGL